MYCDHTIERLDEELRQWERVIRIFPSTASALRLRGAFFMEIDEQQTTGHRFLGIENYWQWEHSHGGIRTYPMPNQISTATLTSS